MENIKINARSGETFTLAGMEFIKFPEVNGCVPVVMRDIAFRSTFGSNNNLRESHILQRLEKEILPQVIEAVDEENVCTFSTDLTTLDGLKSYGSVESRISLPTFDFYRTNVSIFDKHNPGEWWFLATPETARPHYAPVWTTCVAPSGCIGSIRHCSHVSGVRPVLYLKSSIFGFKFSIFGS